MTPEEARKRLRDIFEHEPEKLRNISRAYYWKAYEALKKYGYEL